MGGMGRMEGTGTEGLSGRKQKHGSHGLTMRREADSWLREEEPAGTKRQTQVRDTQPTTLAPSTTNQSNPTVPESTTDQKTKQKMYPGRQRWS